MMDRIDSGIRRTQILEALVRANAEEAFRPALASMRDDPYLGGVSIDDLSAEFLKDMSIDARDDENIDFAAEPVRVMSEWAELRLSDRFRVPGYGIHIASVDFGRDNAINIAATGRWPREVAWCERRRLAPDLKTALFAELTCRLIRRTPAVAFYDAVSALTMVPFSLGMLSDHPNNQRDIREILDGEDDLDWTPLLMFHAEYRFGHQLAGITTDQAMQIAEAGKRAALAERSYRVAQELELWIEENQLLHQRDVIEIAHAHRISDRELAALQASFIAHVRGGNERYITLPHDRFKEYVLKHVSAPVLTATPERIEKSPANLYGFLTRSLQLERRRFRASRSDAFVSLMGNETACASWRAAVIEGDRALPHDAGADFALYCLENNLSAEIGERPAQEQLPPLSELSDPTTFGKLAESVPGFEINPEMDAFGAFMEAAMREMPEPDDDDDGPLIEGTLSH